MFGFGEFNGKTLVHKSHISIDTKCSSQEDIEEFQNVLGLCLYEIRPRPWQLSIAAIDSAT